MIMDFIRAQQEQGRAVESTCRVLRGLGVQVAARTYRAWAGRRTVSSRALGLAYLMNAVFTLAYVWDPATAGFRLRPEGLYGRRKMTALLARTGQRASYERVHTAMAALGHNGIRRARRHRTTVPGKDGTRAGDLLNRDFTAPAPNLVWVTDFTYCRTWAGFVYVAFVVDVFAQRIVAWHAQTNKATDLVMTPLRMALWLRDHEGHPVQRGELVHHSDAGSQGGFNRSSQHLNMEVLSGSSTAGSRSGDPCEVEVAWPSEVPAPCRSGVLGADRHGPVARGSRACGGGVAAGRGALVPQRWRHATVRPEVQTHGPVPIVR
nr:DDE-type integrase/transposase/recombinase [Knoellia sp. DB2414S]